MIIQVTTTDSETGIPPKIGIVKTVSTFSSSSRDAASFSMVFPLSSLSSTFEIIGTLSVIASIFQN